MQHQHRRRDLSLDVRYRMAEEILRRLKANITLPANNSLSVEDVLEAICYQQRSASGFASS